MRDNIQAWKDLRNLEEEFDSCPCTFITDGDIEDCKQCPYVSEENEKSSTVDECNERIRLSLIKDDADKPRLSLVPPQVIEAIGVIRTYGDNKYFKDSYKQVEADRFKDALMRHLCKYLRNPKGVDEESGYKHLWHMACNIAILCELEEEKER